MAWSVNGAPILVGARLSVPAVGAWLLTAEVYSDRPLSGSVAIANSSTGENLSGTIDSARTREAGGVVSCVIVGGAGGWSRPVHRQDFSASSGVQLSSVIAATADAVGERATLLAPQRLGARYVRFAGPAASVLAGRPWWVASDGTTIVGARPETAPSPGFFLLDYDAAAGVARWTSDTIPVPGTRIVDDRFGAIELGDIECELSSADLVGTARASVAGGLFEVLATAAQRAVRPELLRVYECRVIGARGSKLEVQPLDASAPPLSPVEAWPGTPGMSATLAPGARVLVAFRADGDAFVTAYEHADGAGFLPLSVSVDGLSVEIGSSAVAVRLAGGVRPVAVTGDLAGGMWPIVGSAVKVLA